MAVELHPREQEGATVWSYRPVDITIVRWGSDPKEVVKTCRRLSRPVNTPNGNLGYVGLIGGLPIVRYLPQYHSVRGAGCAVVTPGGAVLKLFPAAGWGEFPQDLDLQAGKLGVYFIASDERKQDGEREDIGEYISEQLGVPVRVREQAGEYIVAGRLTDEQQAAVQQLLVQWQREHK